MSVFARVGRLFRGFVSLFISGVEARSPEVLLQAARDDFNSKMAQYRNALAKMAGVANRLKDQIAEKTRRAGELENRIMANFKAGNAELAGALARELAELKADIERDRAEFTDSEEAYQANLRQAQQTRKEFEEKVRQLEKKLSSVQIKEAQADAAGALSNVAFQSGDLGDTMNTVEQSLNKRLELASGKARLAKDLVDMDRLREKESESRALEQNALAEFLASKGVTVPTANPPADKSTIMTNPPAADPTQQKQP
jgi:phage shock protein A